MNMKQGEEGDQESKNNKKKDTQLFNFFQRMINLKHKKKKDTPEKPNVILYPGGTGTHQLTEEYPSWEDAGDPKLPKPNPRVPLDVLTEINLGINECNPELKVEIIFNKPSYSLTETVSLLTGKKIAVSPSEIQLGAQSFNSNGLDVEYSNIRQIKFAGKNYRFK